ncbi:HD domain-containing phosphohydrolase [Shewanella sedimentimangrovi]|uniref:HD domain-containing protein n=1 Tax=Shewanella sedimentimangrovi TaxID=2814293 RepID=A0ABX7R1K1_9GAMM|nr:HD domain-containing phosphohydrolase [Shewanella sedimentimangrovi]QSX37061.1 HD domain-containing protein [Shewanella sedimentimangrovi]
MEQHFHPEHLWPERGTAAERLTRMHNHLKQTMPQIDRVAFALYDAGDDMLKTFINSTHRGTAIQAYQYPLSHSESLSSLAHTGYCRVVDDIRSSFGPHTRHSQWLLDQDYLSSFTLPLYDEQQLIGFLFFDSCQAAAFTPKVQRDLLLYSNLINMAISAELRAIRTVLNSARVAREFAHLRDFETGAHLERMARYSRLIAIEVREAFELTDEQIEHIALFAPLHDVGKIGIPDRVLLKPGPLDAGEWQLMRSHVEKGELLIRKILGDFGVEHLPDSDIMLNLVACHHEFLDGSGYPRGLKGEAIPKVARIVTVADIFDALTSKRPYKTPWPIAQALEELERMVALGKLDALCVAALKRRGQEAQDIILGFPDGD